MTADHGPVPGLPAATDRRYSSLLVVLPRTLLGDLIIVPALQRHPIRIDVLAARQVVGPGITRHGAGGFPNHVKLAVRFHLADVDRFGDVMVRQQFGYAAGEVRRFET